MKLNNEIKTTRRNFLRTSAGGVAVGAAAPFFQSNLLAKSPLKNDRPGVALIGAGMPTAAVGVAKKRNSQGRGSYLGRLAGAFGDVVACCDVDRSHAEGFATRYGAECKVYKDFRKVLERKEIDAVVVATPDHWHAAISIAALKAGKDVYCEKPMTLTIDEGKQICKAVKETGQVFQVGTQRRSEFNSVYLKAVALARSGRLGKKLTITLNSPEGLRAGPFKNVTPPKDLDWDFWLGQTPEAPYSVPRGHFNFRWWQEYSGGQPTDWGAHFVDIAQWALGAEHTGPVQIDGSGKFPNVENGFNTVLTFDSSLIFANGSKIILSSVPRGTADAMVIEGDQGKVSIKGGKLVGKPIDAFTSDDKDWLEQEAVKLYKGKQPGNHMGNFFECIKDRSQPISDAFTHHRIVSSCHLANIAIRLGRKLQWDPVKEDFVGDEEARGMRSREQREPYSIESILKAGI